MPKCKALVLMTVLYVVWLKEEATALAPPDDDGGDDDEPGSGGAAPTSFRCRYSDRTRHLQRSNLHLLNELV